MGRNKILYKTIIKVDDLIDYDDRIIQNKNPICIDCRFEDICSIEPYYCHIWDPPFNKKGER